MAGVKQVIRLERISNNNESWIMDPEMSNGWSELVTSYLKVENAEDIYVIAGIAQQLDVLINIQEWFTDLFGTDFAETTEFMIGHLGFGLLKINEVVFNAVAECDASPYGIYISKETYEALCDMRNITILEEK